MPRSTRIVVKKGLYATVSSNPFLPTILVDGYSNASGFIWFIYTELWLRKD